MGGTKCRFLAGIVLGLVMAPGWYGNLHSQNRDTPELTNFYQRLSRSEGSPEYWVEYKPCISGDHCFVRVTVPNERTVEKIKRREKESVQSLHYHQWKVGESFTLDEIGEVDGMVHGSLPDSE